jgi:hypothetical protein
MTGSSAPCPRENPPDPQVVTNQPGLTSIADRVDDFTGFRRALLRPLPGEAALGAWRPAPGDLGLQFLEWWAYLADVLTFYNERIANETYLQTAQFPESIAGLVALLGYVPAPGLAASGQVAAIRTTNRPNEPLVIPARMQISNTATPGVPVQTFEATATTFSGPTDVVVTISADPNLEVRSDGSTTDAGPASVLLAGKVSGISLGDRLLLVAKSWAGNDDDYSVVTVGGLNPETDPGSGAINTRVAFTAAAVWGTAPPVTVSTPSSVTFTTLYAQSVAAPPMGTRFATAVRDVLSKGGWRAPTATEVSTGTTAPGTTPQDPQATNYRLLRPIAATSLWNRGGAVSPVTGGSGSPLTINLSGPVQSIRPGDVVLFDGGSQTSSTLGLVTGTSDQLGTVPSPEPLSPPPADLVVPYTQLTVAATTNPTTQSGCTAGAITLRYSFRDVGTVLANPIAAVTELPTAVVAPTTFVLPEGVSTALLEDATGAGALVQVSLVETSDAPVVLKLSPASSVSTTLDPPLQAPLRMLFDRVSVSRGKTVTDEVLGDGNAAVANQRFTLKKSPLTYRANGAERTPALTVYVDDIAWTEVSTLYKQPADAQVYVVERTPDQRATIRFGDGATGSRLTSGTGNVQATYRYGSGAASPPAGRLATIVQRQPNLAAIHNPIAVVGGADPQRPEDVKKDAPASVFTFGRAISALDYQVVAAQAPGVTRAKTYWTFDAAAQRTLVKIYVNDDAGGVTTARQALAGSEDPNRPVIVTAATPIPVTVTATLVVAANREINGVVTAATAAFTDHVTGAFSPARMGVGQWLYRSAIASVLSVPGVVAIHQLEASWMVVGNVVLDEVADPGEGAFFELDLVNFAVTGVQANG